MLGGEFFTFTTATASACSATGRDIVFLLRKESLQPSEHVLAVVVVVSRMEVPPPPKDLVN